MNIEPAKCFLPPDVSPSIEQIDEELQNPETSAERVQELFDQWWCKRTGWCRLEDDVFVLRVKLFDFSSLVKLFVNHVIPFPGIPFSFMPCYGELHFPKNKLTQKQIDLLLSSMEPQAIDKTADGYILWGAGRAAFIATGPLPLADVVPLMANEAYMIYRLAGVYGCTIDKSVLTMLGGIAGGSFVGKLGASLLPFLKIPIAAGVTYAVGKAAKAYFASGMTLDKETLTKIFTSAKEEAKEIDWEKNKIKEEEAPEQNGEEIASGKF